MLKLSLLDMQGLLKEKVVFAQNEKLIKKNGWYDIINSDRQINKQNAWLSQNLL